MSDDTETTIPPALTAEEWAKWEQDGFVFPHNTGAILKSEIPTEEAGRYAMIAVLNAALPDGDPRKITREWITALRDVEPQGVESFRGFDETAKRTEALVQQMIAALASYLPPE